MYSDGCHLPLRLDDDLSGMALRGPRSAMSGCQYGTVHDKADLEVPPSGNMMDSGDIGGECESITVTNTKYTDGLPVQVECSTHSNNKIYVEIILEMTGTLDCIAMSFPICI